MREFRKTTGRNSRPQVWKIGVDKNDPKTYIVIWGLVDGAQQETSDTPGTCGVVGHLDYQTAEQYVYFCIDREIRKKKEHGYIEYINGEPVSEVSSSIDFSLPLPKNLCFYKPKKEISEKNLLALHKKGRAIWTLKRDGMMHIIVKNGDMSIYSRRMDLVTEKFPHIVETLNKLDLPDKTILLGEMCLLNEKGKDNFKAVSQICRSDVDLSLGYQGIKPFPKRREGNEVLGKISYYVFDVAFYDGVDLISTQPVRNRLALLRTMFSKLNDKLFINTGRKATVEHLKIENKNRDDLLKFHYIGPLKIYKTDAMNDIQLAKDLKAEGFVVMDADMCYGDKAYSFDGKAQRPDGIFKRKPKYEQEFFITEVYIGSGRNRGRLGGFEIAQIHPDTNEQINCGKCGGGFSDDQRIEFWNDRENLVGKTIKVEFDSRQPPKDGVYSLRFPVFLGFADKEIEECIAEL